MASTTELSLLLKARDEASGVLNNVKTVALGAAAALVGGALLAVKAAADEEVGMEKLAQAMRNIGREDLAVTRAYEENIRIGEKLAFSDGEQRDALALLVTEIGDVDGATETMALAMDLARGTGMDLMAASKLLGKSSDENVNILKRYGIALDKGSTQAELFAEVHRRFGGQAEAFAKTTAGQMTILKNEVDNLVEDVGGFLLPIFTKGVGIAIEFIDAIRGNGALQEAGAAIATIATIAGELFGVLTGSAPDAGAALKAAVGPEMASTIMSAVATIREAVKSALAGIQQAIGFLKEHWDVFGPAFAAIAIAVIIPALVAWAVAAAAAAAATIIALLPVLIPLAAIGAAVALLTLAWNNNFGDIQGKVQEVIGFISDLFNAFKENGLQGLLDFLGQFTIDTIAKFAEFGKGIVTGILDGLGNLKTELWNTLTAAISSIHIDFGPFHLSSAGFRIDPPQWPDLHVPGFASGGIIPGPVGMPMLVVAHGGEEVRTPGQQSAGGGGGGDHFHFYGPVYGMEDFRGEVRAAVRDRDRRGGK